MLTQQDKNRIENAIWILQQYEYEIKELYKTNELDLNLFLYLYDIFSDLDKIKNYFQNEN